MSVIKKTKYLIKGMQEKPKYLYTLDEEQQFETYIRRNFGEFTKVYHELYSPDIHVDILVIPPNKKSNYYKLITMGMGAYKMNVPNQLKEYHLERAELVAFLPPDWDLKFDKETFGWVVSELKTISRLPISQNSWVGFGHTFSKDEKSEIPFSKNTKLTSTILLTAVTENCDEYNIDLILPNKGVINFYQVFPLYKEELDYIRENSIAKYSNLISTEDFIPIIDLNRPNYCASKLNNKKEGNLELDNCEEELEENEK